MVLVREKIFKHCKLERPEDSLDLVLLKKVVEKT